MTSREPECLITMRSPVVCLCDYHWLTVCLSLSHVDEIASWGPLQAGWLAGAPPGNHLSVILLSKGLFTSLCLEIYFCASHLTPHGNNPIITKTIISKLVWWWAREGLLCSQTQGRWLNTNTNIAVTPQTGIIPSLPCHWFTQLSSAQH